MTEDTDTDTDSLSWETRHRETAYVCPGFTIQHEQACLPDGTETEFDYLSDDPSVVIIPFTADGEVVVIDEWRQAVKRVNRGFPAGGVEDDDTDLNAAARRELEEETGYIADTVERITTVEPANGVADAVFHYYVARGCEPTGNRNLDYNESIRVETTSFEALVSAVRDGGIRDGRTALGVLYYHAFGQH